MENYSQLEPLARRRMKKLRPQGMTTHLNYSSKDVDEEREMEAPPGFRPQPPRGTEEQTMEGIPSLLATHLRETETRRRTMSPREAPTAHRIPMQGAHHSSQQLNATRGGADGRHEEATPLGNNMYPPNHTYPPNHSRGGYENNVEKPSPLTRWIEEFQFPNGLKVPPHLGYYDGKGDPDNFIHVFEWAMRMEKWAMMIT
nr:reverse transcriptase domain-containing protein [Tanacetum cinerariifolium]